MSVRGYYLALRTAGAAARDMLRRAAAQRFGVEMSACYAVNGAVHVRGTTKSATFGQLASAAAALPVPAHPALTPANRFRIIGRSVPRLDVPAKVRGAAVYGIDVRVPGMQHAVVVHCPSVVGTLTSPGPTPPGAGAIVPLDNAVVVVAATTWHAMRAARALRPTWSVPSSVSQLESQTISAQAAQLMTSGVPVVADAAGDAETAFAGAAHKLDLTYTVPYLPHATMEPLACTASVTSSGCEVWAPTQAPGLAAATAAAICGLPADKVTVHTTMLGGGLGRKFETDFVAHAVAASKAVGTPVKVTWTREEDFGHDQYRPMARMRIRAGLGAGNALAGWWDRIVSPSILYQRGWIADGQVDSQAVDGALALPYAMPARLVEYVRHPAQIPVGFWRSVGNSINCFAVESAMDELARAANVDPIAFRLAHMTGHPRAAAVLRKVAALSGWSTTPPAGRARGVAITASFGSIVAQVAEVSQPAAGRIKVEQVWCVIDCGQVVNPGIVEAQLQGGIVHGMSAALWGGMTFERGVASPRNFDDYRMTRMRDMPRIAVAIMPSTAAPGGVGEPGVPPVAPAVANAWARLTGVRKRSLPLN
jgi:isoquinoline 1-oxidoreductase beta subunit